MLNEKRFHSILFYFCLGIVLVQLIIYFIFFLHNPPFLADSWSYYELSKTIFTDFYRINTYRQYQYPQPYGISFAPLYPFLIALFNSIFHLGVYGGYVLNFIFAALTIPVLIQLSRMVLKSAIFGVVIFALLFYKNELYIGELIAAKNVALAIFLTFSLITIFVKYRTLYFKHGLLLGFLSGLICLNRFDFMLAAVFLGVLIPFSNKENKIRPMIAYFLMFFLTISPWMFYSFIHFSKPFISDNSRTVLLAFPNYVTDYYPNATFETLFNNPLMWIQTAIGRFLHTFIKGFILTISQCTILPELFFLALIFAFLFLKQHYQNILEIFRQEVFLKRLLWFVPVFLIMYISISLTGYPNKRYFIPMLLYGSLLLFWLNITAYSFLFNQVKFRTIFIPIAAVFLVFNFIGASSINNMYNLAKKSSSFAVALQLNPDYLTSRQYEPLVSILRKLYTSSPVVLFDMDYENEINPFQFGALTGITTLIAPNNLNRCNLPILMANYHVTHVYTGNPDWQHVLKERYVLRNIENPRLYEVSNLKSNQQFLTKPCPYPADGISQHVSTHRKIKSFLKLGRD